MKIEQSNNIRIIGTLGAEIAKELQKGSELPARILERTGSREAIVEIAGKKIHAEFLKGLPAANSLVLQLEDIKNNSVFFKLIDPAGRDSFIKHITDSTIFDNQHINKQFMYVLNTILAQQPHSVYELNLLLANFISDRKKKDDHITRFLNNLAKRGMSSTTISDLSLLFSGLNGNTKTIQLLMMLLGITPEQIRKWTSGKADDIRNIIKAIADEINSLSGTQEQESVIKQLISLLTNNAEETTSPWSGEFASCHDDILHPIRYVGRDNSWIFSVDFSHIGRIDILAKTTQKSYFLSIFCSSNDTLDMLQKEKDTLIDYLSKKHTNIYINLYNMQNFINKIVEINSYYSLNSVFDIKV